MLSHIICCNINILNKTDKQIKQPHAIYNHDILASYPRWPVRVAIAGSARIVCAAHVRGLDYKLKPSVSTLRTVVCGASSVHSYLVSSTARKELCTASIVQAIFNHTASTNTYITVAPSRSHQPAK